jgi:hypothetical protein
MKASTSFSTAQAPVQVPAPEPTSMTSAFSPAEEQPHREPLHLSASHSGFQDPQVEPGDYRDFGIND